jgi:hypothetical protein
MGSKRITSKKKETEIPCFVKQVRFSIPWVARGLLVKKV